MKKKINNKNKQQQQQKQKTKTKQNKTISNKVIFFQIKHELQV